MGMAMEVYNANQLVALCLIPAAFNAGSPVTAIRSATRPDKTPFAANSGPAIVRDAIYGAVYSRLKLGLEDADITEAIFQAGRSGFLAAVRQLAPPFQASQVNDADAILAKIRPVIDGTPAVDRWGRLLSYDEFIAYVAIRVARLIVRIKPPAGSPPTWTMNISTVVSVALQLYMICSYLERLFGTQSISLPIKAYAKVMQRYIVANAFEQLAVVFDQNSAGGQQTWLLQTSKRIQESAMATPTSEDLSNQLLAIMKSSSSSKDASEQLAALNSQYVQRVERARVYDSRYQVESRHVRSLRWAYVAWVVAYIAVVIACTVLIVQKQDQAIFVLAAVIIAVSAASYLVQKVRIPLMG